MRSSDDPQGGSLTTTTDHFHYGGFDFEMTAIRVGDRSVPSALGDEWSATAATGDPRVRFDLSPDDLGGVASAEDVFGRLREIITAYIDNNPGMRSGSVP